MSYAEVQDPVFTETTQSQSANALQTVTIFTNHAETIGQSINIDMAIVDDALLVQATDARSTAEITSTITGVEVEMLDIELSSMDSITNATETQINPRESRFANLGLNARPLKFVGWKEPSPGLSVHTPIYAAAPPRQPLHQTAYQQYWSQESDDIDDLETMMVPASVRQAYREGANISIDPRPPIIRTSKFSTGFLTESGWTAINNPNNEARVTFETFSSLPKSMALEHEFVGYDDLPGTLAKKAEPAQPIDKVELNATMQEIVRNSETPYLDAKYFDLDSYLEYSHSTNGQYDTGKTERMSKRLPLRLGAKSTTNPHRIAHAPSSPNSVVAFGSIKRGRKLLPKLPIIADDNGNEELDEDVPSPPESPSSDSDAPPVKSKEKYEVVGKAGIPTPTNHLHSALSNRRWQPIEDSYILLLYKKVLSAAERGHAIRAPGPTPLTEAFNNFFVGKVIAHDLPACEPRREPSIKSHLQQSTGDLKAMRDTTRVLLVGKKGGPLYVPVITQEELEAFMADGTVQPDDPNDEAKNDAKSPKRKREVKDVVGADTKRTKQ